MKYFSIALIYSAFFAMIFGAVYFTDSAWCLWALLLTPSIKTKSDADDADADDANDADTDNLYSDMLDILFDNYEEPEIVKFLNSYRRGDWEF